MSESVLTFAGFVRSRSVPVPGARIDLVDFKRKEILAATLSNETGRYRLEFRQEVDPGLYRRVVAGTWQIRAVSANEVVLAQKQRRRCKPGEACFTDLEVASSALRRFKPFGQALPRLQGGLLEEGPLQLIDGAIEQFLAPKDSRAWARYSSVARSVRPPIAAFSRLLDDAWGVLDGHPGATRAFRTTLNLLSGAIQPQASDLALEQGKSVLARCGCGSAPTRAEISPRVESDRLGSPRAQAQRAQSLRASLPAPVTGRLFSNAGCLLQVERMVPVYGAIFHIGRDDDDVARMVGALELSLCGLGWLDALVTAATEALATGDARGLHGQLDHHSRDVDPGADTFGGLPPRGPQPYCPDPPFPEPTEPPGGLCDLQRFDCLDQLRTGLGITASSSPPYVVASISDIYACPGSTITILGSNFGVVPGLVCFPFGFYSPAGSCVQALLWTDTEIRVVVPPGAGSGELYLSIYESTHYICGKFFVVTRNGIGNRLFLGGRAVLSSLTVDGSVAAWTRPDRDVRIAWVANRGGAGTVVQIRVTQGTTVHLDQSGLADNGSLMFHVPAFARETTLTVTATATNPCGTDTRSLFLLVTVPSELTIEGIEVTQATQFYRSDQHLPVGTFQADNTVPLIESKRTLVRVFLDSGLDGFDLGPGDGVVPGVSARLQGWRGITPLPGLELTPLNSPINAFRNTPYLTSRAAWDRSLNFELPLSWCQGNVRLRVVVDPLPRRQAGTVDSVFNVGFVAARPLKLVGVMVRYEGWQTDGAGNRVSANIAAPPVSALITAGDWLRRTYPVNDVQFFTAPGNESITFDGDLTDGSGGGCGDEWGDLMEEIRDLADDYEGDDDAVWVGVLPGGWNGSAWGGCGGGTDGAIGAAVIFAGDTGPTLAQEAGHGYGRAHAPGCGAGGPDPNYPAYGKTSTASIGEFGVNIPAPGTTAWRIQDPEAKNDFMGYCGSDWVSPYTYMGLFNGGIGASSALPAGGDHEHGAHAIKPGDAFRDILMLRGRIWETGQVSLRPSFHFPRRAKAPVGKPTDYRIEQRDEAGRSIDSQIVRMTEGGEHHHAALHFFAPLALSPKTRELVILVGDRVLLAQPLTAESPRLRGLLVTRAARGRLSVVWHATGQTEKLWHKVRYSADGGNTWLGVVRRSTKPAVNLNLARLPGGENCLVEVYSTDGIRTARLRSKRFKVPHRPPTAVIGAVSQPAGAQRGWVRALGAGFDEAGRALSKDALRWHSNKDGDLGTGDALEMRLSAGEHKISLVASDKAGRRGRSEISVRISGRA